MTGPRIPGTREEVAALEASYRAFEPAAAYARVGCDAARWQRHADALRTAVDRAEPRRWSDVRERFVRAAALDSTALAELVRPVPDLTTFVLGSSLSDEAWSAAVEEGRLVAECHRRALHVAAAAAAAGRPIDESMIARLQDLIVEAQATFTVSVDGGARTEIEMPRRQYKPVSNYLVRSDLTLVPFAPAGAVAREMRRLETELASADFAQLHPVVQSAYLHVALIRVHPFADGNGRLARTLASVPLLRAVGLPQLILSDQWPAYVQALLASDDGDPGPLVRLFLAAQVNSMDLARNLLSQHDEPVAIGYPVDNSPRRTVLDLVEVHLREAVGVPPADVRVAVTRNPSDRDSIRLARTGAERDGDLDLTFRVACDDDGWARLTASPGQLLELWQDDVHPVPTEIVHLRVRAWLDMLLRGGATDTPPPARGLFVLGVPRSGTTVIGNWIGSHPAVLGLAEYGGFYVAHSVAPSYLGRLPGAGHDGFLASVRAGATEHADRLARAEGKRWFCDATPWNLEIAGALAEGMPDAVFVLLLRHFSGAVVSLHQFPWAGRSWPGAGRLWSSLNAGIAQLPGDRTVVVDYDALAARPAETVAGLKAALAAFGLDPARFDDRQFAGSHAHVVGRPRPTIATLVDDRVEFGPIPSLDEPRWTPEVHEAVWPVVAAAHGALRRRFGALYLAPPRPPHVPADEW